VHRLHVAALGRRDGAVGAGDGSLDQLAQDGRLAADELVDRVDVNAGGPRQLGDRRRPVTTAGDELAGDVEDPRARLVRSRSATGVVVVPLDGTLLDGMPREGDAC